MRGVWSALVLLVLVTVEGVFDLFVAESEFAFGCEGGSGVGEQG